MQVVIDLRVAGLCRFYLINSCTSILNREDISTQTLCRIVECQFFRSLINRDGRFLTQILRFIACGEQMNATFHLDGQRELDIVLALCGIDNSKLKFGCITTETPSLRGPVVINSVAPIRCVKD